MSREAVSQTGALPAWVRPATAAATSRVSAEGWGWLPGLSVVASCGLLLVALADSASLHGSDLAAPLFYAGLLTLLVPVAARLVAVGPARRERVGLVLLVGMALYLVKVMHSPLGFTFADEFIHWHNTNQILQTQRLFAWNTILPATPYYPGLEVLTSALVSLSGLPVFDAGLIVIGVARLILFLGLFLLADLVSRSARVAGISTLLFMCHPFFLFFSAQYSYESLSLPLVVAILFIVARRSNAEDHNQRVALSLLVILSICAVVVTHHLSVYFLAGFLLLWTLIARFQLDDLLARILEGLVTCVLHPPLGRRVTTLGRDHLLPSIKRWTAGWRQLDEDMNEDVRRGPAILTLFTFVAAALWLFLVANLTISYLRPVLNNAVISIIRLIAREQSTRVLFVTSGGYVPPLWERVTEIGSVLLGLLVLPFGLLQAYRRRRGHTLMLALGCLAVAYFGLLAFRLTPAGWETATRGSSYAFIGLSFILALGITEVLMPGRPHLLGHLLFSLYAAVLFIGGFLSGWQPNVRLAQPYVVEINGQPFIPQSYGVAEWARSVLGPANGFATDFANGGTMLAIGEQKVVAVSDPNAMSLVQVITFEPYQVRIIQDQQVRYVLMDNRRISQDGLAGRYFDRTQGKPSPTVETLDPALVGKYEQVSQVNRIMDSGNIVIYDMETYLHVTPTP